MRLLSPGMTRRGSYGAMQPHSATVSATATRLPRCARNDSRSLAMTLGSLAMTFGPPALIFGWPAMTWEDRLILPPRPGTYTSAARVPAGDLGNRIRALKTVCDRHWVVDAMACRYRRWDQWTVFEKSRKLVSIFRLAVGLPFAIRELLPGTAASRLLLNTTRCRPGPFLITPARHSGPVGRGRNQPCQMNAQTNWPSGCGKLKKPPVTWNAWRRWHPRRPRCGNR